MNAVLLKEKPAAKSFVRPKFLRAPKHVALIMDGNRRWAKKRNLPPSSGHWYGAEALAALTKSACDVGIEVLTVYAFSTENWRRSPLEVKALMRLFKTYLLRQKNVMIEEGVRLNAIGDLSKFPADVRRILDTVIEETSRGDALDLVLALNYGGRDELKRAVSAIVDDCLEEKISKDSLSEALISSYLDTAKWPDPELVIRTSGERRMSNFLLWQSSYAEVVVTDVLWPDFSEKHLLKAISDYQKRELRIGR